MGIPWRILQYRTLRYSQSLALSQALAGGAPLALNVAFNPYIEDPAGAAEERKRLSEATDRPGGRALPSNRVRLGQTGRRAELPP